MIDLFPHAEIVSDAVPATRQVSVGGLVRYGLLDRGSYEVGALEDPVLVGELCELAARRLGRESLVTLDARVVRLCAGDYLLARHEPIALPDDRRCIELVLDVSPAPVDAEIHYRRRGQVFFRVPSVPRSLAIVERTPSVTCNHTYVSKRTPDAVVTRLIVLVH